MDSTSIYLVGGFVLLGIILLAIGCLSGPIIRVETSKDQRKLDAQNAALETQRRKEKILEELKRQAQEPDSGSEMRGRPTRRTSQRGARNPNRRPRG